MKIGNEDIVKLMLGDEEVLRAYLGDELVYENQDNNDYIQNGLVFHLDGINKGPNEGKWTDLVDGIEFENHGAVSTYDGWLFDNDAANSTTSDKLISYLKGPALSYLSNQCTLEICFIDNTNRNYYKLFATNLRNCVCSGLDSTKRYYGSHVSTPISCILPDYTKKIPHTISSTKDIIIKDGVTFNAVDNNTYALSVLDGSIIGGQLDEYRGFTGKIYSIRIYNRLLTEEEMIHNQQIDYNRFNLANVLNDSTDN